MKRRAIAVVRVLSLAATTACGPVPLPIDPTTSIDTGEDGATTGREDGGPGSGGMLSTSDADPMTTATSLTTSGDASSSSEADASAESGHGGFIDTSDGGATVIECDIWIDDCPPGQKCMPWANDGGSSWNATKCSPLAEAPNQVGDPCTVEASGISGIDDCEARSMCWDVDPETNTGTCVGFCSGSEANPTCGDPCTPCSVWNDGVLILCLAICDPLSQDCQEGNACWPTYDGSFACMPDPSPDTGALGDGCEFANVCDPGLFCAPAEQLPDCAAPGCCSAFCDVSAADPCPDLIAGTECIPWYDEGEAPPCFAHVVGGCLLPE